MLYAAGIPDEESMQTKPHVGIASVFWEGLITRTMMSFNTTDQP